MFGCGMMVMRFLIKEFLKILYNNFMKNISIWYNRYGVDECYGELKGEWNKELWGKIEKMIDWCEGYKFEEFEEEIKGEGWVMYGWDGVGVFVVDEGCDVDKCKDEYDVKWDV